MRRLGQEVEPESGRADFDCDQKYDAAGARLRRFLTLLYPLPPRPSPDERTIAEHPFQDFPPPFIVGNPNYPEPYPQP
jgi:hypothetical protein